MKAGYKSMQLWSGTWYRIDDFYWHECCDCGLVHGVSFKLEQGRVLMRWNVDTRQTARARAARRAEAIAAQRPPQAATRRGISSGSFRRGGPRG